MDYVDKIYTNPIREASMGVKPHLQESAEQKKPTVSRSVQAVPKVVTSEQKVEVTVS